MRSLSSWRGEVLDGWVSARSSKLGLLRGNRCDPAGAGSCVRTSVCAEKYGCSHRSFLENRRKEANARMRSLFGRVL